MDVAWLLATWFALSGAGASPRLGAWLTYWDVERGRARLATEAGGEVDDVLLFFAALSPDGSVVLSSDEDSLAALVSELEGRGQRVWLTVVNDVLPEGTGARPVLKDAALVHRLLSDPASEAKHRRQIVALARRLGVSGVDVDYENLDPADRDRFTSFVAALSASLRDEEILLSVTAQPKTGETGSKGPGALDWRGLCPHVDRLQVMLYNLHSGKTEPGPMATLPWMKSVLEFALSECGLSRVVPVVKLSGMEWSGSGARTIQYDECMELARSAGVNPARDEANRVPYFSYLSAGEVAMVYFEDAVSIEAKAKLLESMGFRDVVLWSLGREDPEILPRIAR
jgi:spore germination protein YaaH